MPTPKQQSEQSLKLQQQQQQRVSRKDFVKRPKPSLLTIVPEIFHTLLQAIWGVLFHHFFTTTLIAPFFFQVVRSPSSWFNHFMNSNSALQWLNTKLLPYLQPRGNDIGDVMIFTIGTTIVHAVVYIVVNGGFYLLDRFSLLQQYRIPEEPRMKITRDLVKATLIGVTKTIFITGPIGLVVLFFISKWKPMKVESDIIEWNQPIHIQILQFWLCILFNHFFFYVAHRALHEIRGGYPKIHNVHHKWINSISISAEYSLSSEAIFANFFPTYGACGFILSGRGVPMSLWFTFLAFRLFETCENHSAFDFNHLKKIAPGYEIEKQKLMSPLFLHEIGILSGGAWWHCYHHSNFLPTQNCAYGQWYLDLMFGTVDGWLNDPNLPAAPCQTNELEWQ